MWMGVKRRKRKECGREWRLMEAELMMDINVELQATGSEWPMKAVCS